MRGTKMAVATIIAVAALVAGFLAARFVLPQARALSKQVTVFPDDRAVPEFCLVDQNQQTFCRERLLGHWTILFFGFTHCPDICPLTLRTLAEALGRAENLGDLQRPEVVLISVDPMRDTPAQIGNYVEFFDPDFVGVTGELIEVQKLTKALGVAFRYISGERDGEYSVEHTAAVFLVGPDANVRALLQAPHRAEILANDLSLLIDTT